MVKWRGEFLVASMVMLLLSLNLQAGNENSGLPVVQIKILKNGQVLIAEKPVKTGDIEQIAKDVLKANPKALFRISRSIETAQDVFLAVLNELKKADAKKVSVAVPTDE